MITWGQEFDPNWDGWPPAMPKGDYHIWQRLRPLIAQTATRLWYNVGLGGIHPQLEGIPQEIINQWILATQKRIDVLAETPTEYIIIEIRQRASPEAIGRLLTYHKLFITEAQPTKPVKLMLATDREDPDVRATCNDLNITYIVI